MTDDEILGMRVKAELRRRLRGLRQTTPASALAERSRRIVLALQSLEVVTQARSAALFWPIEEKHEVDLRPLDTSLRAAGARVAYPSIDPETRTMTFRFVDDPATLEERGMGFAEPPPGAEEPLALDVVIVPAIAIDAAGFRIGYGAGFYDMALPRWLPGAVLVGVAYDFQLLAEIPRAPHDVPVAWIVTDRRTLQADPAKR